MPLSNFFRINLPYGIKKNSNDEWIAFNREYMPLGWNKVDDEFNINNENTLKDLPVFTKYKSLTEKQLLDVTDSLNSVKYNSENKIDTIYLYDDKTNPSASPEHWNLYFEKIKKLSVLVRVYTK